MGVETGVDRFVATILFADVAGSTEMAATLGDAGWKRVLASYYRVARSELKRHGGREIDTAGDGLFAAFDTPARALHCAQAIVEEMWSRGVPIRVGLHTGECEQMNGKVGGMAVHIGARVASLAGPGEIVLTSTVRDLAIGAGLPFESRGTHALKGVPSEWQVFAIEHPERMALPETPIVGDERARPWWRSPVALIAAACVIVAAVVVPVIALQGNGTTSEPAPAKPVKPLVSAGVVRIDPDTNTVTSGTKVPDGHSVIIANGFVWVAGTSGAYKVFPKTGKVVGVARPGVISPWSPCRSDRSFAHSLCSLSAGDDRIWLVNKSAGADDFTPGPAGYVFHVDPGTTRVEGSWQFPFASAAVFYRGDLWVACPGNGTVLRVDPHSGTVKARIPVESTESPKALAAGLGSVWVVSGGAGGISRIEPATNMVAVTIPVQQATSVAVGEGGVWITSLDGNTVTEYSADGARFIRQIRVDRPTTVGVGLGSVWVVDSTRRVVDRLDPQTGHKKATIPVGWAPFQFAFGFGSVWAAGPDELEQNF